MKKNNIEYDSFVKILRKMNEGTWQERDALYYLFLNACEQENLILCEAFLEAGFDINHQAYYANVMNKLIERRKLTHKMADWLIENNIDMTASGLNHTTPAISACQQGDLELAKYLVSKEDFENKVEEFCLAIEAQNYEVVNEVVKNIQNEIPVNNIKIEVAGFATRPILFTVLTGNVEMTRLLLENNANANEVITNPKIIVSYDGATFPMDIAITKRDLPMQELLKEFGGKASSKDDRIRKILKMNEPGNPLYVLHYIKDEKQIIEKILENY